MNYKKRIKHGVADEDTFCSERTVIWGCEHGTLLVCSKLVQLYMTLIDKFYDWKGREAFTITQNRDSQTKLITLIVIIVFKFEALCKTKHSAH
jgi:hypothetical protein